MTTPDDTTPDDTTPDDSTPATQADPQTHLDTDPANAAPAPAPATEDDPAHDAGEDEGWTSEGGATESGPATDT